MNGQLETATNVGDSVSQGVLVYISQCDGVRIFVNPQITDFAKTMWDRVDFSLPVWETEAADEDTAGSGTIVVPTCANAFYKGCAVSKSAGKCLAPNLYCPDSANADPSTGNWITDPLLVVCSRNHHAAFQS